MSHNYHRWHITLSLSWRLHGKAFSCVMWDGCASVRDRTLKVWGPDPGSRICESAESVTDKQGKHVCVCVRQILSSCESELIRRVQLMTKNSETISRHVYHVHQLPVDVSVEMRSLLHTQMLVSQPHHVTHSSYEWADFGVGFGYDYFLENRVLFSVFAEFNMSQRRTLFTSYMLLFGKIIRKHIFFHCYADNNLSYSTIFIAPTHLEALYKRR